MFSKKEKGSSLLVSIPLIIITVVLVIYILWIWSSLLIPFIIALLFSFAIIWLMNFYKKFRLPSIIAFILSIATYGFVFWGLGKLIWSNIDELIRLLPEYQKKIVSIIIWVFDKIWIEPPKSFNDIATRINFESIFTSVISWVTWIFWKAWIIIFYVIFLLLEYRYFGQKLRMMIRDESNRSQVLEVIAKIRKDIKSYFVIKTFVSLFTGVLSYLVMTIFGLDFAIFWAFLVFALNFIPSIWSIIAVTFPVLFSLVQFDSYYVVLFMASGLIWVQVLMWNIIEPRFVWNKLNLSPLVIILALGFWGGIWWVVWMLLSVPIMVIINIILAKIPATRSIAVLLSEKWDLQIEPEDKVLESRKKLLEKVKKRLKAEKKNKKKSKK